MNLSRRELIAALGALGIAPSAFARDNEPSFTFAHGVASGDPQRDRVILWTHVTPTNPTETVRVRWAVASDPGMKQVRQSGRVTTDRIAGAAADNLVRFQKGEALKNVVKL